MLEILQSIFYYICFLLTIRVFNKTKQKIFLFYGICFFLLVVMNICFLKSDYFAEAIFTLSLGMIPLALENSKQIDLEKEPNYIKYNLYTYSPILIFGIIMLVLKIFNIL